MEQEAFQEVQKEFGASLCITSGSRHIPGLGRVLWHSRLSCHLDALIHYQGAWDRVLPLHLIQLPASVHPGRQCKMAQVLGSLLLTWAIQVQFLDPGFSLVQYQLLEALGK